MGPHDYDSKSDRDLLQHTAWGVDRNKEEVAALRETVALINGRLRFVERVAWVAAGIAIGSGAIAVPASLLGG